MTIKKVAGFHSFERGDLTVDLDGPGWRKNLGTIESHKDG